MTRNLTEVMERAEHSGVKAMMIAGVDRHTAKKSH